MTLPDQCRKFEEGESNDRKELYTAPILLCAEAQKGSPCLGDSGSPAVSNGKLIGIVTQESPNCKSLSSEHPTIYTNIKSYFDWILENTGEDAPEIKKLSYTIKL